MSMRPYPEASYFALKARFRRLLELCGGIDGAAASTRISRSQLHNYGNPASDLFPPVDVVLDLERAADAQPMTEELASARGMILVTRTPSPNDHVSAHDILTMNARVVSEVGDVLRVTVAHASDGELCINDLEEILREQDEMLAAGTKARQAVQEELVRRRAKA